MSRENRYNSCASKVNNHFCNTKYLLWDNACSYFTHNPRTLVYVYFKAQRSLGAPDKWCEKEPPNHWQRTAYSLTAGWKVFSKSTRRCVGPGWSWMFMLIIQSCPEMMKENIFSILCVGLPWWEIAKLLKFKTQCLNLKDWYLY